MDLQRTPNHASKTLQFGIEAIVFGTWHVQLDMDIVGFLGAVAQQVATTLHLHVGRQVGIRHALYSKPQALFL